MNEVSQLAATLKGSEIIRLASDINARRNAGATISNLTIGDFDPSIFPLPARLEEEIHKAYQAGETNYPPADGLPELRKAVARFHSRVQKLDYQPSEFLVAGGARPLIYAAYQVIADPGDKIIFPVPSWNNNHYCHLTRAEKVEISTTEQNHFMPTGDELEGKLHDASLLALCSPLNPTGTMFTREQLQSICRLVLEENRKREGVRKPLYVLYDQVYWTLTFQGAVHTDPVSLSPEMRPYTLFVDGASKAFAATGIRVGWAFGPEAIISRMKSVLGHIGAWAPRAEQAALARFLEDDTAVDTFLNSFRKELHARLDALYQGITTMKKDGLPVEAITPSSAIYLTVRVDCNGAQTPEGKILSGTADTTSYLLDRAGIAMVPFMAFGSSADSAWYRISVGTIRRGEEQQIIDRLRTALSELTF